MFTIGQEVRLWILTKTIGNIKYYLAYNFSDTYPLEIPDPEYIWISAEDNKEFRYSCVLFSNLDDAKNLLKKLDASFIEELSS